MKRLVVLLRSGLLLVAFATAAGCGGYDACGDKSCGDPCTVCDPDDADCTETQETKACNSRGVCATAAAPSCG